MTEPITMTAIAVGVSLIAGIAFALYAERANFHGEIVVVGYITGAAVLSYTGLSTGNIPTAGLGLGLLLSLIVLTAIINFHAHFTGGNPA